MKTLKRAFISALLLSGGAYGLYRFLLTDEAKEALLSVFSSLGGAYENIARLIEEQTGSVVEEGSLPNREATERQWANIGY